MCSMMLVASCYEDYSKAGNATTPGGGEPNEEGDVQVENLDESSEV